MISPTKTISLFLMTVVMLTSCNVWEQPFANGDGDAHITVAWPQPAVSSLKANEVDKSALPPEISSIGIIVLDNEGRNLATGELFRGVASLTLSVPAGIPVDIIAEARAGSEVLFRGSSTLGSLTVGEARGVRLPLQGNVALDLDTPQTAFGAGGNVGKLTVHVQGLKNTKVKWYVNDVENGNQDVGVIDEEGVYTPPPKGATNKTITVRAEPLVAPSFGREVVFRLVDGDVSVRQNSVFISGNEIDPDPSNNAFVETTTLVDAP